MRYPKLREETDAEFDDGGTPMWRARHAQIAVVKQKPRPYVSPAACFLFAFIAPFVFLFFVIVAVCLIQIIRYGLPDWF